MSKCIIISAGDFEYLDFDKKDGDMLIACDGGFHYLNRMGMLPNLIVGDFDSLSENAEDMRALEEINMLDPGRIVRLNTHKDDTDTMTAIKIGLSKGFTKFYLYGMLGGKRLDHTIANIQSLLYLKNRGATGYIMEKDSVMLVAKNEEIRFHNGLTGMLSIFALEKDAKGVTLKGLEYEMDNGELHVDYPMGVSNEFVIDEEAVINVTDGTLLLMATFDN